MRQEDWDGARAWRRKKSLAGARTPDPPSVAQRHIPQGQRVLVESRAAVYPGRRQSAARGRATPARRACAHPTHSQPVLASAVLRFFRTTELPESTQMYNVENDALAPRRIEGVAPSRTPRSAEVKKCKVRSHSAVLAILSQQCARREGSASILSETLLSLK
jgi:hypothetical protein